MTRWLDELNDDIRLALRTLRASPTFAAGATITLALAIGANGAIFALADATVLRPIPFPDPQQLVMLSERTPESARSVVAPFEFDLWRQRSRSIAAMAAVAPGNRAIRGPDGNAEQIPAQSVSTGFFDVLQVRPILGRTFRPSDDRPGADAVVLAEPFWRSRFGADSAIVGRRVQLDGQPFTVVGVVPARAQILTRSSAWTVMTTATMRSPIGVAHYLNVVGRLRSDRTIQMARADMDGVAATIARERPTLNADRGITIEPLAEVLIGQDLRLTTMLLGGVVALVLLAGCANIANLLLVRAAGQAREFMVRAALGAPRRRLVRQVLTESLVLASLGGVFGVALAGAILRMSPSLLPEGLLPVTVTLVPDPRVIAFCALATVAVAMACGLVPAWRVAGESLALARSRRPRNIRSRRTVAQPARG